MITVISHQSDLLAQLGPQLNTMGLSFQHLNPATASELCQAVTAPARLIICDHRFTGIDAQISADLINGLSQRTSVIVVKNSAFACDPDHYSHQLNVLAADDIQTMMAIICTVFVRPDHGKTSYKARCQGVPVFNIHVPVRQIKESGGLGILTIDASNFSELGLEYGVDVYTRLKAVFQDLLFDLWGRPGCFREDDILCRKTPTSNIYYLFLASSRTTGSLPYPGALEKVADRVLANIQKVLLEKVFSNRGATGIPSFVTSIPLPSIGFIGILENPCIDPIEVVEAGIEDAGRVAYFQMRRQKERQQELMQTLIQADDLLTPRYQGVFHLQHITKETVDQVQKLSSLAPLRDHLFGFESLIRVNAEATDNLIASEELGIMGLEAKHLRPDVLFGMAKATKVSLELDQACLRHAAREATDLPGTLMINILPRNLYYIEKLEQLFSGRDQLMFEVSESEAINNFELMKKSCAFLKARSMDIAADDFGKGFSSLERIIKIRPGVIKFDRSMIEGIDGDAIKQAYVKGMVRAARIIQTTVLAEGVETWEEARTLQEMGIELVQGFLFHRPSPAEEIKQQLNQSDPQTELNTVA